MEILIGQANENTLGRGLAYIAEFGVGDAKAERWKSERLYASLYRYRAQALSRRGQLVIFLAWARNDDQENG